MSIPDYSLYQRLPGLVLGFHGCDAAIGEGILRGDVPHLKPSNNKYDWLGDGIYFWENDPLRALEFAEAGHRKASNTKGYIAKPFVLGAVIDLGLCLNLTDRRSLGELAIAHRELKALYDYTGEAMPVNKGHNFGARFLDRACIELLHALRGEVDAEDGDGLSPYDTVRSPFREGDMLYDGAGFQAENHIQIAVCNIACIRGYFRPIAIDVD
jgi:hypothetical protein